MASKRKYAKWESETDDKPEPAARKEKKEFVPKWKLKKEAKEAKAAAPVQVATKGHASATESTTGSSVPHTPKPACSDTLHSAVSPGASSVTVTQGTTLLAHSQLGLDVFNLPKMKKAPFKVNCLFRTHL